MLNNSHPITPPISPPFDQTDFSSDFISYRRLMNNIRQEMLLKRRYVYRDNDHPDRENPLLINEILYESDHDKILDEMKFNFASMAQQKQVDLNGVHLRNKENARLHRVKIDQLQSRLKPRGDYI